MLKHFQLEHGIIATTAAKAILRALYSKKMSMVRLFDGFALGATNDKSNHARAGVGLH
jgi:hypothetical protein